MGEEEKEEKEEMEEMVREEQQKVTRLKSGTFGGLFTISTTYNLLASSRGNLILKPRHHPSGELEEGGRGGGGGLGSRLEGPVRLG